MAYVFFLSKQVVWNMRCISILYHIATLGVRGGGGGGG